MNAKQLIAAVAVFAAAGSAFAEAAYPAETPFTSTKTRADVIAELEQARAQGLMPYTTKYPIQVEVKSTLTREEVQNEVIEAAKNHHVDTLYSGA